MNEAEQHEEWVRDRVGSSPETRSTGKPGLLAEGAVGVWPEALKAPSPKVCWWGGRRNRSDGLTWSPFNILLLVSGHHVFQPGKRKPNKEGDSPLPAGISNFTKRILGFCKARFRLICGYCCLLCCSVSDYLGLVNSVIFQEIRSQPKG